MPRADPVFGQKAERLFATETQAELPFAARAVKGQRQHVRRGLLKFFQARAGKQREQRITEAAEKMSVHAGESSGEQRRRQQGATACPAPH